jgi:hypothetical protein
MGAPAAGFQANWTELKETDGKIKGGVNPWCYGRLIECLDGQREQGEGGRAPPCRGRKEGEEERKGKTEADRWDPPVGAAEKKRGRGVSSGPAGKTGLGRLGRKGGWVVLFFFSFSFSNFIFKSIFNSNSNQTFANFSQKFYRLFRDHTSNQETMQVN